MSPPSIDSSSSFKQNQSPLLRSTAKNLFTQSKYSLRVINPSWFLSIFAKRSYKIPLLTRPMVKNLNEFLKRTINSSRLRFFLLEEWFCWNLLNPSWAARQMKIIAKGTNWIVDASSLKRPVKTKVISASLSSPKMAVTNPLKFLSSRVRVLPKT